MTQEELFNYCLNALESPDSIESTPLTDTRLPTAIPDSIFHLTNPSAKPLLLAQICIHCSRFDVIKVMKSGIFHKGGLKGRPLSKNNLGYVIYNFKDLISFILLATSYVTRQNPDEYLRYYNSSFDRAINQIERLKSIASNYSSKRNFNKLFKIKSELEMIKSNLISKPIIPLPPVSIEMGDSIDLLILLFKQELPAKTPELNIAEAISSLFDAFNISVEPDAVRQRMTRAKQK